MTLAEYSAQALATWAVDPVAEPERARTHAALMLVAEAGEVAGEYQRHIGQGHPLDRSRVVAELGDVLWALCAAIEAFNFPRQFVHSVEIGHLGHVPSESLAIGIVGAAHEIAVTWYNATSRIRENPRTLLEYIAELGSRVDATIDEIMAWNLAKLARRYSDGFTPSASIHRTA